MVNSANAVSPVNIEDELKQEKHVKELFLRQINELQRLIDNK